MLNEFEESFNQIIRLPAALLPNQVPERSIVCQMSHERPSVHQQAACLTELFEVTQNLGSRMKVKLLKIRDQEGVILRLKIQGAQSF